MDERDGARRAELGRSSRAALPSALALSLLLVTGCSGEKGPDHYTPPMFDTGARLPDPCRVVGGKTLGRLVGPSTMVREKNGKEDAECRWESSDPSPNGEQPSGLLQVAAFTQAKQVKSAELYGDAKIAYKAAQREKTCTPLRTSADEACWQYDDLGLHLAIRKGYTTITVHYGAAHSPALGEHKREQTATELAAEVLTNLSA
ncbi:hypothetical protein F8568_006640 [Actinomadura sp. LD22]|uniref:DUF3558 domain-containing protein n=1 Tax=Actinomadura physcomitrii TaxID=2650748 RepID=A0A6I4MD34_9ACTN|nr:hypothetical protein [Actinomadura physcomitrii]MWA00056.1 hypothetical protein [Actinomadura physcomitrii]